MEDNIRILLVDDDHALLDALPEALTLRAPRVLCDTADGGLAALSKLDENDYDAVISDIKMPGVDGIELLTRVRVTRPEIPVLLITGHGETDLAIQALRAGAYDLIPKPLDRDYLISALNRAAEARRLRREVDAQSRTLAAYAEDLERRVEERTAELVRANQAKDEFLGLVSHELRTPITVILGNADVLARRLDVLSEKMRTQVMTDLVSETRRLQRIVENLLVLARLDHTQHIDREPLLLREVVAAEVRAHHKAFPRREVVTDLQELVPLIMADSTHIELVIRNLLSNAEKYSPEESPIQIKLIAADESVTLSVLDEGPGVPEAEAERIFSAFYRSPQTSHIASGIGIGLAVCTRLVEAAGGRMFLRPRESGGSEFGFTLLLTDEVRDPTLARRAPAEALA
jgi:K+-sensing histidine kinase KdpD